MSLLQSMHASKPLSIGRLDASGVHDSLIEQAITCVWNSLIPWRNHPDCPLVENEKRLNGSLSKFLTVYAKNNHSMLYFHHEEGQKKQRSVDISANSYEPVIIHGRGYTVFQPILLIEAKRLPAPSKAREREYVTGEDGEISGGIQRFKVGEHGHEHSVAVLIGYVQEKTPKDWYPIINGWISELVKKQPESWSSGETLSNFQCFDSNQRAKSTSIHSRNGCMSPTIQLHHFWIQMK